ncbi:MAG: NADP-dependent malic enzyme [Deltaproteobacteria bacterium]|nr:NADP-dependent malic enzyme [Deltaproteobacteria bacterium]
MRKIRRKDALNYHSRGRPGKLEVISSKPCVTSFDLSMAYTPGVAVPCLEIEKRPNDVFKYTGKANLVAVVSNCTAVLGLGDIGPMAGKPVMEGKGVLFKRFADVDVFDIELDSKDPDEIVNVVRAIAPTFGGINLEDIKAPECFYIEEKLKGLLDIPVFHDDQHGTAIISAAGLLNAAEIAGKDLSKARLVVCGAGAAGIACTKHFIACGIRPENVMMVDSRGVIYEGREEGMNPFKQEFANKTEARTLADALEGADVFMGLSKKDMVSKDMVASMAKDPILFAMANPDPEISFEDAKSVRSDVIMATGRSDYPNQVNNVLGFPFIFRGALDVRAQAINENMKMAATRALAALAKEEVPDQVAKAYGGQRFRFGRDYIIPKPFDYRVLTWEAPAVAKAAMETGVARIPIDDWDAYRAELERRINPSSTVMRKIFTMARTQLKRIVFPEGDDPKVLRAAQRLLDDKMAKPILIGRPDRIDKLKEEEDLDLNGAKVIDPISAPKFKKYVESYRKRRSRRGVTLSTARISMQNPINFALMMLQEGDADGVVTGVTMSYSKGIRPALKIIGPRTKGEPVFAVYMVLARNEILFFADTTVNIEPSAETLSKIAVGTARFARSMGVEPRVAMLSFANFGASPSPQTARVREATKLAKETMPDLMIDGEMQVDVATDPELRKEIYPFCELDGTANVFVFPSLEAANIGYKLLDRLGGATVIGPILVGMKKPVNVLQHASDMDSIVNVAAFTAVEAQGGEADLKI